MNDLHLAGHWGNIWSAIDSLPSLDLPFASAKARHGKSRHFVRRHPEGHCRSWSRIPPAPGGNCRFFWPTDCRLAHVHGKTWKDLHTYFPLHHTHPDTITTFGPCSAACLISDHLLPPQLDSTHHPMEGMFTSTKDIPKTTFVAKDAKDFERMAGEPDSILPVYKIQKRMIQTTQQFWPLMHYFNTSIS